MNLHRNEISKLINDVCLLTRERDELIAIRAQQADKTDSDSDV